MASTIYGHAHRQARKRWAVIVNAGQATCCLCRRAIYPGQKWHLDHLPGTANQYRGVAHAHCNTSEGATRGNKARGVPKTRRWVL